MRNTQTQPSTTLSVAPMFLEVYLFSTAWLVRIYVRGCIPKLFLARAIMMVVGNIVRGVKLTFTMAGKVHSLQVSNSYFPQIQHAEVLKDSFESTEILNGPENVVGIVLERLPFTRHRVDLCSEINSPVLCFYI